MGALVSGCCGDPENVQEGNRKWSCRFLGSNLPIRTSPDPRRPTHQDDHGEVEPAAWQGDDRRDGFKKKEETGANWETDEKFMAPSAAASRNLQRRCITEVAKGRNQFTPLSAGA